MLKWLRVIWFLFGIFVFGIILLNGLQRCYINYYTEMDRIGTYPTQPLSIDLYATSLDDIPIEVQPGMTLLIDQGAASIQTGIWMIRSIPLPPIKVNVPEVGQWFLITKGKFAGLTHKIKPSFLELTRPTETQVLTHSKMKSQLHSDTLKIFIPPADKSENNEPHFESEFESDFDLDIFLDVTSCLSNAMRKLDLELFSSNKLHLTTIANEELIIQCPFIGSVYFYYDTEHKLVWYTCGNHPEKTIM